MSQSENTPSSVEFFEPAFSFVSGFIDKIFRTIEMLGVAGAVGFVAAFSRSSNLARVSDVLVFLAMLYFLFPTIMKFSARIFLRRTTSPFMLVVFAIPFMVATIALLTVALAAAQFIQETIEKAEHRGEQASTDQGPCKAVSAAPSVVELPH